MTRSSHSLPVVRFHWIVSDYGLITALMAVAVIMVSCVTTFEHWSAQAQGGKGCQGRATFRADLCIEDAVPNEIAVFKNL